jgi:hypothetical protein
VRLSVTRLGLAGASIAVTLAFAAAPALAARPPVLGLPATPSLAQSPLLGSNPLVVAAMANSTGLGGYASDPAEGFGSVTTTFTVPTITCEDATQTYNIAWGDFLTPANSGSVGWRNGFDGYALVVAVCNAGTPSYEAQTNAGANNFTFQVSPGDSVSTRIADTNTGEVIAQLTDFTANTSGASATFESGDPEWQVGTFPVSSNVLPVFTKVTFKNTLVNGAYMNQPSKPTPYTLSMNGDAQVVPSAISATKPVNSFSDTEKTPF